MHGHIGWTWGIGVVGALLAGCPGGDDGESVASAETGETGGPTSTTVSSTDATTVSTTESTTATTTTGSMTTSMSTSTSTTTTDTDTDSTGSESDTDTGGIACGELICNSDQYCDWGVNSCGEKYDEPACAEIPDGCAGVVEDPVCGCDGIVYSGECAAAVLGMDVDEEGACPTPEGLFQCGYKYCDPELSYCQVQYSDIGGYPNGFACMPLPDGCGVDPSCECLAGELCGSSCEASPDGGYIVSCAGG